MAVFNNHQPNDRDRRNIITKGFQFFSSTSKNTLSLNCWNDIFISVKISPMKEDRDETETKYDYDNAIGSAFSVNKAYELLMDVPRIKKAFEEGTSANSYVDVNGNNLIGFGTMNSNGKQVFYLAIHRNLDDTTRIPEKSAYFEFGENHHIEDYDASTGKFARRTCIQSGEFNLFVQYLEEEIKAANKATAHSVRMALDFTVNRLDHKIDSIGKATGANFGYKNNYPKKNLFADNNEKETMNSVVREAEESLENTELPDLNLEEVPF